MKELAPELKAIYDMELALGNVVARVHDAGPLPLSVVFEKPLHRAQIESSLHTAPNLRWYSVGSFAGYVHEESRQSVQGPTEFLADQVDSIRKRLASNLRDIFDFELANGNRIARVDEPAGDTCPLAVVFNSRLHRSEIESSLTLPASVRWWECRDPHYPIEGGFACGETGHVIAGPLK